MLVVSYNPGYQSILKDLKQSTRQRFVAMEFDYPDPEAEAAIVAKEGGVERKRRRTWSRSGKRCATCAATGSKKASRPGC